MKHFLIKISQHYTYIIKLYLKKVLNFSNRNLSIFFWWVVSWNDDDDDDEIIKRISRLREQNYFSYCVPEFKRLATSDTYDAYDVS